MEEDNTWYVAITEGVEFSYLVAASGRSYKDFAKIAKKDGVTIVAEQFEVSDATINRLDGFDASGKRISDGPLAELVKRLNHGEQFDVQKELTELCQTS